MVDQKFFKKKKKYLSLKEVLELTECELSSKEGLNLNSKISSVNTLLSAGKDEAAFLTNVKYISDFKNSNAGFCFVTKDYIGKEPEGMVLLVSQNPHFAYTQLLNALYEVPLFNVDPGISKSAYVSKKAKIGKGVQVCDGVYIGDDVIIGDGCKIGVNTVINHGCEIGDETYIGDCTTISYSKIGKQCIIQAGARIGQCGFGFAHNKGFNHKVPQLGLVIIGDFVEIGANTCIDRGALEDTVIDNNSKLDNLIQIAHGVKVGQGCFFAACVGVAGSTKFGNFVQVGGNAGINGHITIGDGAQIAGQSGVVKPIEPMQIVGGYPSLPIKDWHRINIKLNQMIKK